MNQREVAQLLAFIAEVWPSYPLPQDDHEQDIRVAAWSVFLDEVTLEEARDAVVRIGKSGEHFAPAPGEVHAEVMEERRIWARDRALSRPRPSAVDEGEYDQARMDDLRAAMKGIGR